MHYKYTPLTITLLLALTFTVSGIFQPPRNTNEITERSSIVKEDILSVIEKEGHEVFVDLVRASNMTGDLGHIPKHFASSQYTVFAPHDSAFKDISEEKLNRIKNGNEMSKSIVKNHIVLKTGSDPIEISEFGNGIDNEAGNEITIHTVHGNRWIELENGMKVGLNSQFGKKAMNGVMYPVSGLFVKVKK